MKLIHRLLRRINKYHGAPADSIALPFKDAVMLYYATGWFGGIYLLHGDIFRLITDWDASSTPTGSALVWIHGVTNPLLIGTSRNVFCTPLRSGKVAA